MEKLRILIVEDESIVAMDLEENLTDLGFFVAGVAHSAESAIQITEDVRPDLILLDIVLKGEMDGVEFAECIRHRFDTPVVYLTSHSDEATLERAMSTGPYGYILKPFTKQDLYVTIKVAFDKHKKEKEFKNKSHMVDDYLSTKIKQLLNEYQSGSFLAPSDANALTGREKEILELLASGKSSKEIAILLHLSPHTVDSHRHNMMEKFAKPNVTSLVSYAISRNLITVD